MFLFFLSSLLVAPLKSIRFCSVSTASRLLKMAILPSFSEKVIGDHNVCSTSLPSSASSIGENEGAHDPVVNYFYSIKIVSLVHNFSSGSYFKMQFSFVPA